MIAESPSEIDLTRKYGLLSIPLLAGGLGLFLFALYQMLEYLNL